MQKAHETHLSDHDPVLSADGRVLTFNIWCPDTKGFGGKNIDETPEQITARLNKIATHLAEMIAKTPSLQIINLQEVPTQDPNKKTFLDALNKFLANKSLAKWRIALGENNVEVTPMRGKTLGADNRHELKPFGNLTLYNSDQLEIDTPATAELRKSKTELDAEDNKDGRGGNDQRGRSLAHVFKVKTSNNNNNDSLTLKILVSVNVHYAKKVDIGNVKRDAQVETDIRNYSEAFKTAFKPGKSEKEKANELIISGDFNVPLTAISDNGKNVLYPLKKASTSSMENKVEEVSEEFTLYHCGANGAQLGKPIDQFLFSEEITPEAKILTEVNARQVSSGATLYVKDKLTKWAVKKLIEEAPTLSMNISHEKNGSLTATVNDQKGKIVFEGRTIRFEECEDNETFKLMLEKVLTLLLKVQEPVVIESFRKMTQEQEEIFKDVIASFDGKVKLHETTTSSEGENVKLKIEKQESNNNNTPSTQP